MKSPAVSIITVVWPNSPPIEQIGQAIVAQTLQQWEWLIISVAADTGALNRLAAADPRIRVIDLLAGVDAATAHDAGLKLARAEYALSLDHGDLRDATTLEQWRWFLEAYPEYTAAEYAAAENDAQLFAAPSGSRQPGMLLHGGSAQTRMFRKGAARPLGLRPRGGRFNAALPEHIPFGNQVAKRRPRLLLILPWLAMGGADKFNLDMVRLLTGRYGYEVTIATIQAGDYSWRPMFAKYAPDLLVLPQFLRPRDYPRFLRYLIASRQIDTVLLSNSFLGYSLLPYLRAHYPDLVFMDYLHAEDDHWKNGGYPRASLEQAGLLDLTVVASQHLKQWLIERGGDEGRIEVCTVNIDTAEWDASLYDRAALRSELGIGAKEVAILYAARICLQKQPKLLVNTMLELERRGQQFVCLVAGDGPDRAWLEQTIRSKQLRSVRMLGGASHQRMHELMAISDIFFLPSEMEGISMAIYEAMAIGAVPVGADVGGQRELVTPECGMLIARDQNETAAYIAALAQLIGNPELRQRMRQAARQRVMQGFQIEQMGARMAQLIEQAGALAAQQPRPAVSVRAGLDLAAQALDKTRQEQSVGRILVALPWARRLLRPVYRWAAERMLPQFAPMRNWLRQLYTQVRGIA